MESRSVCIRRSARWTALLLLVVSLHGQVFATPVSNIHKLAAYQQADLVCFGQFTEIGGYSAEELTAHGGPLSPVKDREFSGTFQCKVVFKGYAGPGPLQIIFENRLGYVMYGASEPVERAVTGLVLFLKGEGDHFRLVDNTPYCAIAAHTAGKDPEVRLPAAAPGDTMAVGAREVEGLRQLWNFLKTSYENNTPETACREYLGIWPGDLFLAIAELGAAPELKADQERYLKDKSAKVGAPERLSALQARGYEGDRGAFKEAMIAYKKQEIPLRSLRAVSHTLLSFDQGVSYPDVATLAEAIGIGDEIITQNVSYALRFGEKDEDVPLLVSILDAQDETTRHNAVIGLYRHEEDDNSFPLSSEEYAPGVDRFHTSPDLYTNRWKVWWNQHGKEKYAFIEEQVAGK